MTVLAPLKIGTAEFKADPFSYYRRLRDESPVHRVTLPDGQSAWLVTRYDDVVAALKDERLAKNHFRVLTPEQHARRPWIPASFRPLGRNMLNVDPPDHTRLRALVQQAFSPRLVEGMRERIEALSHELLDRAATRGRMDLIHDYALPIPTTIIAEMLGVGVEDRHKFNRWSNRILAASGSRWGMMRAIPSIWLFMRYVRRLIQQRHQRPGNDLITALIGAKQANDVFSDDELLAMIFLLIIAGHETTVNLIASGMLALLEHPAQLERLRQDPALIKPAIEELLRYTAAVELATERYVTEDFEFAGVRFAHGDMVFAVLASANRDERQFPDPDALDIAREPNRHVAFGQGIHFCLGASLARLEGQIAIQALLDRTADLRLAVAPSALKWRSGLVLRGLTALPVRFTPRSKAARHNRALEEHAPAV
jgi:cytochrome P450 PksS